LKTSFKALWKKGDVNRIQERLDRYQKVLDTKILINLRSVRTVQFCKDRPLTCRVHGIRVWTNPPNVSLVPPAPESMIQVPGHTDPSHKVIFNEA
jgi:hypothetical protein